MEKKIIKFGNHVLNNDSDGYMYNLNFSKSYSFGSHMHKCYEFTHIIAGKLLYTVEQSEYVLTAGDIIMTAPGELHSFSFPEECEYYREFLHIYPNFLSAMPRLGELLSLRKPGSFNLIPREKAEKYGMDLVFRQMQECCENPFKDSHLMMLVLSAELILKAHRILSEDAPVYDEMQASKKTSFMTHYINHHFAEDINATKIAEAAYMSAASAAYIFKKETGMTIKAYLTMRRITQAKNLIMEGRKATRIFERCGFGDYSTFYRAFIKYTGMTPNEFKLSQSVRTVSDEPNTAT